MKIYTSYQYMLCQTAPFLQHSTGDAKKIHVCDNTDVLEICIVDLPFTLSFVDSYLYIKPSRLYI